MKRQRPRGLWRFRVWMPEEICWREASKEVHGTGNGAGIELVSYYRVSDRSRLRFSTIIRSALRDEMIEIGEELELTNRATRIGSASRSLLSDLSKSRANYWAAYAVDFTCPVLFAYLGLRHHPGWASILINSVIGLFVFSLVEYVIHRWLLHNPKSVFYPLHEAHHNQPEEPAAGLFPTSLLILMPVWLLLTYGLHWQGGSFFLCGLSAGNFYFDSLHNLEHSTRINQIPFRWLQGRWAAHSVHHRLDHTNFGVMTSFWDYVFQTHQKQKKRKSISA